MIHGVGKRIMWAIFIMDFSSCENAFSFHQIFKLAKYIYFWIAPATIMESPVSRQTHYDEVALQHHRRRYPAINSGYLKQRIFTPHLHAIATTSLQHAFQLRSRCHFITSEESQALRERRRCCISTFTREWLESRCYYNWNNDIIGLLGFVCRSCTFLFR